MGSRSRLRVTLVVLGALLLLPSLALAQSSITGVVRDTSGAVVPGVNVEAASEALIERSKTTVTDSNGQYRIIDLRPGLYTVTFSLDGFQTVKQENLDLPGEFTMTLNGTLSVGRQAETIVVTAQATLVDTSNTIQVTRLDRNALETLPSGQNIWELGQMIPGVQLSSPTVGGQGGATQTYMSIHGMDAAQNLVLVDGLSVNGMEFNGAIQNYFNPANSQEIAYQTSGINADRSGGGVTINMIPREGGNKFSGDANVNYKPGGWIGDNFTDRLQSMGTSYVNSLEYLSDWTVSEGGPIKRDRLWFFTSFHQFDTSDLVANTIKDDGSQGNDAQRIRQGSVRLTYQLGTKNKFSGYFEKIGKLRTNQMGAYTDPETASVRTTSPNYATGAIKYTSTLSNKFFLEAGYSLNREHRDEFAQEGILQDPFSDAWYRGISITTNDTGGARTNSPALSSSTWPQRDNLQASLSLVTASHNAKIGFQYQWGNTFHDTLTNGDLTARFDTFTQVGNEFVFTTPFDVTVRNTPVNSRDRLNHDIGIYAQDSWRWNRLTMNYGLRWEDVNAQNDAASAPVGRFVPARNVPAVKNVPDWSDIAPRFNVVYDLFGNARTALKYGINRYNHAVGTLIANGFNTLSATSRQLPWTDLNNDGIPQAPPAYDANSNPTYCVYLSAGCEINLSALRAANGTLFGTPADQATFDGYERGWNLEQSVEIQHELTKRVSVNAAWFHSDEHDLTNQVNIYRQQGDYTPFKIYNPADGTPIEVYGIKDTATQARLAQGGAVITFTDPARRSSYNQFLFDTRARLSGGAIITAAWTSSRERQRDCAADNPDYVINPNELRFCDGFNLPDGMGIPYAHDFRMTFNVPYKGFNIGIVYLNNDEGSDDTSYSIIPGSSAATSTTYPTGAANSTRKISGQPAPPCPTTFGCVPGAFVLPSGFILPTGSTTLTLPLIPVGSNRSERLYQVDLRVSRTLKFGNVRVLPTLDIGNLFNSDHIIDYVSQGYATSAGTYLVPDDILLGRVIGIGATVKW